MSDKILNFNRDTVYGLIIILILIVLGFVTANYYAFVSVGKKSALNFGTGANIAFLPQKDN